MSSDEETLLRVPARLVAGSEAILQSLGLSAGEAVRLFLTQVSLRRGSPFAVMLPPVVPAWSDDDLLASPCDASSHAGLVLPRRRTIV